MAMAKPKRRTIWCQRCHKHRTRYPRLCNYCKRWVGPGCEPERCLARDGWLPEEMICRDCNVPLLEAMKVLTRSLHPALMLVKVSSITSHIVVINNNISTDGCSGRRGPRPAATADTSTREEEPSPAHTLVFSEPAGAATSQPRLVGEFGSAAAVATAAAAGTGVAAAEGMRWAGVSVSSISD